MRIVRFLLCLVLASLVFITSQREVDAQDNVQTEPLHVLGKYGGLADFAWSPDGSTLAVSTYIGIVLYDQELNEIAFLEPPNPMPLSNYLLWSPDGSQLFAGNGPVHLVHAMTGSDTVYVWDMDTRDVSHQFTLEPETFGRGQAWNRAGDTILLMISDRISVSALLIWNIATDDRQEIDISSLELSPSVQWRWSEDEQSLVTIWREEQITIPLTKPTEIERTVLDANDRNIVLSPNGAHQASNEGGKFVITNANGQQFELAGDEASRFRGFQELAWSANSERVAAWGRVVPSLMVADVLTSEILLEFTYSEVGNVVGVELSPDGSLIALSTVFDELLVIHLDTGEQFHRLFRGSSTSVSFSPDGSKLASVTFSTQQVYIWDTATGELLDVWETPNEPRTVNYVASVAWSPDGQYVATGSMRGGPIDGVLESRPIDLFIWSVETGEVVQIVPALAYDADFIAKLEWSADSQSLAYSTLSNQTGRPHIGVYNLQTQELNFQSVMEVGVWDIALHPTGDVLALTRLNLDNLDAQQIIFVDAQTGELLDVSTPPIDATLRSIDWHPSGDYLAALVDRDDLFGDSDSSLVQIWSWQMDVPLGFYMHFDLEGGTGRSSLEWSPQGDQLATLYYEEDNTLGMQVWDVSLEDTSSVLNSIFVPDYPAYFLPSVNLGTLSWSSDGSMLATNLSEYTSSIWEVPAE